MGSQILGDLRLHQSTAAPAWWCGPRPPLGWVEMAFDLPNAPSYPGHSPQKSEFGTDNYYFGESAIRVGDVITTPQLEIEILIRIFHAGKFIHFNNTSFQNLLSLLSQKSLTLEKRVNIF